MTGIFVTNHTFNIFSQNSIFTYYCQRILIIYQIIAAFWYPEAPWRLGEGELSQVLRETKVGRFTVKVTDGL